MTNDGTLSARKYLTKTGRNATDELGASRIPTKALFVLPSDIIGGAERLLINLVSQAAHEALYDSIDVFVLRPQLTVTIADLNGLTNTNVYYSKVQGVPSGIFSFTRFLRLQRYDLVFATHTHVNALCCTLRRLGILKASRLVTRESTVIFERDFGPLTKFIPLLIRAYGSQDLIVCQTERMRKSFVSKTGNRLAQKCKVIANPINLERIAEDATYSPPPVLDIIPPNRTKIVWCGRFVKVKAPILAVKTLRALHEIGRKDMHLIMIGDGPLKSEVEAIILRYDLSEYITLTGPNSTPAAIMTRCDLGLLTSEKEGFPNVVLEMLAAKVPRVFTTNCAGDLSKIPGVWVTKNNCASDIAERIIATDEESDTEKISEFLKSRQYKDYLGQIS